MSFYLRLKVEADEKTKGLRDLETERQIDKGKYAQLP